MLTHHLNDKESLVLKIQLDSHLEWKPIISLLLEWVNEELMNDNVADSDDNEDNSAFKAEDIFARYQQ